MRNLFIAGVIASALLIAGCPKAVTPPPPPVVQHFVTMHWDDVRAPGYTIYRGASPDALAPLDVTANPQYADKHVAAGETYYYDVKSRNDAGDESAPSNVINATIPSGAAQ